jgi:hypothetical protein
VTKRFYFGAEIGLEHNGSVGESADEYRWKFSTEWRLMNAKSGYETKAIWGCFWTKIILFCIHRLGLRY